MSIEKDKIFEHDSENKEWTEKVVAVQDSNEEQLEDVAIDLDTGARISATTAAEREISEKLADNQEESDNETTTTETVVLQIPDSPDEVTGLSTNQILMAILGVMRDRNTLAAETNKRLRDQNKILKKIAGLYPPTDKTLQGTLPKEKKEEQRNDEPVGFPE
jgi:seryl-tRNA synthetase